MPSTGVKTDSKESDMTETNQRVYALIKEGETVRANWLFKYADEFHYLVISRLYPESQVISMFRTNFCKVYDIPWKESSKNKMYLSFSPTLAKIRLVAGAKDYEELRNSGRSFNTIWNEVYSRGKDSYDGERAKKRTAKEKKGGKWLSIPKSEFYKAKLAAEAKEGVVNAKELVEATVNKEEVEKPEKEPNKSWTNPKVYNLDKELAKQMKELYMGEPKKFFLMMARIITADTEPISPKWRAWRSAAEQEMKAYGRELAK